MIFPWRPVQRNTPSDGSRAPGPRAVWPLRTVFVSLKSRLASYVTANYYRCLLLLSFAMSFCHFPWNSAEMCKFRGWGQIPRLGSKFRGPRKTVGPSHHYCGEAAQQRAKSLPGLDVCWVVNNIREEFGNNTTVQSLVVTIRNWIYLVSYNIILYWIEQTGNKECEFDAGGGLRHFETARNDKAGK
jgi:hypothetical protein